MAMNLNCRPVTKVLPEKPPIEIISCPIGLKRLRLPSPPIGVLCIDKREYAIEIIAEGGARFGQYYKRVVDGDTIIASRDGWKFRNHVYWPHDSNMEFEGLPSYYTSGLSYYYDLDRQRTFSVEGYPGFSFDYKGLISLYGGGKYQYCKYGGPWSSYTLTARWSVMHPVGFSPEVSFIVVQADWVDPYEEYSVRVVPLPVFPVFSAVSAIALMDLAYLKIIPFEDCFMLALAPYTDYTDAYIFLFDANVTPFPLVKRVRPIYRDIIACYCGDGFVLMVARNAYDGYYYLVPLDFTTEQTEFECNISLTTDLISYKYVQKTIQTGSVNVYDDPLTLSPRYAPFTLQTTCTLYSNC